LDAKGLWKPGQSCILVGLVVVAVRSCMAAVRHCCRCPESSRKLAGRLTLIRACCGITLTDSHQYVAAAGAVQLCCAVRLAAFAAPLSPCLLYLSLRKLSSV